MKPRSQRLRSLNRSLNCRVTRRATRMLGGARRPRQPNPLREACRLLARYIRLSKRAARKDPHLFGPRAPDYYRDTLRLVQEEKEDEAAIRKVYGPPAPGATPYVSTLWTDRYVRRPRNRKRFLKWFQEHYP